MFDASLRRTKDRYGESVAALFRGVSPNTISLASFVVGMFSAGLAFYGWFGFALILWIISRLLDGLDGLIARVLDKQTDFGGYLDILCDFAVYAILPIAIVQNRPSPEGYLALAFLLATFNINGASWMYLAAILEKRGSQYVGDPAAPPAMTSIIMPSGLVGAAETILAYCLFLIWPSQAALLFTVFGGMVVITTLQRLAWAWHTFGKQECKGPVTKNETQKP
jgi:phosphatidylglycerophosphate synthase